LSKRFSEGRDDLFVILQLAKRDDGIGAIGEIRGVLH